MGFGALVGGGGQPRQWRAVVLLGELVEGWVPLPDGGVCEAGFANKVGQEKVDLVCGFRSKSWKVGLGRCLVSAPRTSTVSTCICLISDIC